MVLSGAGYQRSVARSGSKGPRTAAARRGGGRGTLARCGLNGGHRHQRTNSHTATGVAVIIGSVGRSAKGGAERGSEGKATASGRAHA